MRHKMFALVAAVAVLAVAVGGVSAGVSSSETPETDGQEIEPDESEDVDDETTDSRKGSHADEAEAGICVVGADSPCNSDDTGHGKIGAGSDDEEQIMIPEDQNRDGEIDNRFSGEVSLPAQLSALLALF